MMHKTDFIIWTLPTVVFAVLLAAILSMGVNVAWFLYLNDQLAVFPDVFWSHTTFLMDALTATAILAIILRNRSGFMAWVFLGAVICGLIVRVMKLGFDINRPPLVLDLQSFNTIGNPPKRGSFPSGHTATAFFLGAVLLVYVRHVWNKTSFIWPMMFLLIALIGGLSRIAVGVHWPADLAMGAIIGWLTGYGFALKGVEKKYASTLSLILMAITYSLIAWLLISHDPGLPGVEWLQAVSAWVLCLLAAKKVHLALN